MVFKPFALDSYHMMKAGYLMKLKRILAWIGIILLAGMYILTLVFSLMHGEVAMDLFKASIFCTIIIPVLLYAYNMIYRYLKDREK